MNDVRRPEVALITNHGYGGADIPTGGARDTGGQNVYVNAQALALERLGYRVTIFARGGFPHFGKSRLREEPEQLSEHVRYVFAPGGGSDFIHKEAIAVALDEQLEWLDTFVREQARERGCRPWEVYGFVNTHYWDAAVLGTRLVERWRNDVVADTLIELLGEIAADANEIRTLRHWKALGEAPEYHLGWRLISVGPAGDPLADRVRRGAEAWVRRHGLADDSASRLTREVASALDGIDGPSLQPKVAADALGRAALALLPEAEHRLAERLARVDIHVWTPHSLGELKDWNFRDKPLNVRRDLRFCERRAHERMICKRTRVFVATSAEIGEVLRTHYGVPTGRLFYYPPGIDSTRFRVYEPEECVSAYRYLAGVSGLSEGTLRQARLVFETSRMDRTKRKDLLLTAFASIAATHKGVYLFIGGGPDNEIFEALQQQLETTEALRGRAFLTGAIPDEHIGPLFSMADVYASASEMEGFGMSVAQAAAAGVPVVSSDMVPFAVDHAPEACVVFPAGDAKAFAGALRTALDDPTERRERLERLATKMQFLSWRSRAAALIDHLRKQGIPIQAGRTE